MITLRTLAITLRWETSERSEKRSDTFKRITCVLGREWVEGAQARKSSQGAIAVIQVNDVGAFVEVFAEVRLWVVLKSKTRRACRLHVQWEGKKSRG